MSQPRTAKGRKIADETIALAHDLERARVSLWRALLDRRQMVPALAGVADASLKLPGVEVSQTLPVLALRSIADRKVAARREFEGSADLSANMIASVDRDCRVALGSIAGIELWRDRQSSRFDGTRRVSPRYKTWRRYWSAIESAAAARLRARNAIVIANQGLVVHYVDRRATWMIADDSSLVYEDLKQSAMEGLHRAADLYNPGKLNPGNGRPYQFSTYACHWLRHYVDRAYQSTSQLIKVPLTIQIRGYKIGRLLDATPGMALKDLAAALETTVAKIADAMAIFKYRAISLDKPEFRGPTGNSLTLAEVMPDPSDSVGEQIDIERVAHRLAEALEGLSHADRSVIESRFGIGVPELSCGQIAMARAVPRSSVEQTESRALTALREAMA